MKSYESDFQIEGEWYILSKTSQFEVCSTVSLNINGSLAGISDFGEDIVSEAGSDSSGISPSSHDGSKSGMDSVCNTEPSIISGIFFILHAGKSFGYTIFKK